MSSREKPKVVWVRSLVPKEKNSASLAMSSAHIAFIDESGAAECERRDWLIRHGIQYHWRSRGYASFDDFLGALTSRKRKSIRKEREAAREDLEFRSLRGSEIGPAEWDAVWAFYQDTGARKWGHPYLTREFFDLVRYGWPHFRAPEVGPPIPDAGVL